jgi:hypothetical protein
MRNISFLEQIVSLVAAGLYFSMWRSCVCNGGEVPMRQTCIVFERITEEDIG